MAVWDTSYLNALPDSAFLYIAPGGKKDADGKTVPRSLRHFPVKDASGDIDLPHLRNALARIPQSNMPDSVKAACTKRAEAMLAEQKAQVQGALAIELFGPLAIEAAAADKKGPRRFSGTLYAGGPIKVKQFAIPVIVDLAGLTGIEKPRPLYREHDESRIVGHMESYQNDGKTLADAGTISAVGPDAQEVCDMADNGFPWQQSIEVLPVKESIVLVPAAQSVQVNGRSFAGPVLVARRTKLVGASVVGRGADDNTTFTIAASAAFFAKEYVTMEFDKWVEALGLSLADLTETQAAALRAEFDGKQALVKASAAGGDKATPEVLVPEFDADEIRAAYAEHTATLEAAMAEYEGKIEAKALADIRLKAIKAAGDFRRQALREKWAGPKLEVALIKAASEVQVELIRAERPKAPAIHGSTRDLGQDVIQAAFCRSVGLQNLDKQFKPEVLEAADRLRGFSLGELLLHHAIQAGYSGRMKVTQGNLGDVLRAAFSTHTISTMLSSTGNKILLDGFNAIPQSWREVAQVRTVTDFKQVTAFRLNADLEYEELPPSGEIKHGTLGQESYTVQARTHAKMLTLTRVDIINDDLGAFNDLRNRLGLGSAIAMNKKFWTVFLAASAAGTFWTAARGNLVTGAPLGEAGLDLVVAAFRNLAGPDGNLLNLEPDRMLVPPTKEATARKLYVSTEQRDTTGSTKFPTANIYYNRFRPVVVPELGNAAYTGYSPTTYYLLAPPAILAAAIMCFLAGQESPTIESADTDFSTLGIQLRGYHDFGADMSEWRSSVEAQA